MDASRKKKSTLTRETYEIVKDYSEYSTIQGVIYLFQSSQTQCGKAFWMLVIVAMLILGTYWSVSAYSDWIDSPVLTTVKTTALNVKQIDFPAITICGQGVSEDLIVAGWFKIFLNYTRQLNISFGLSPIRAARAQNNEPSDDIEKAKLTKLMVLISQDPDHVLQDFLNKYQPGFMMTDPLTDTPPILASRNPDDFIRMQELLVKAKNFSCPPNTSSSCAPGFSFDAKGGNCYKVLADPKHFWDASTDACSAFGAKLVSFANNTEVQGLIDLISSGKASHLLF